MDATFLVAALGRYHADACILHRVVYFSILPQVVKVWLSRLSAQKRRHVHPALGQLRHFLTSLPNRQFPLPGLSPPTSTLFILFKGEFASRSALRFPTPQSSFPPPSLAPPTPPPHPPPARPSWPPRHPESCRSIPNTTTTISPRQPLPHRTAILDIQHRSRMRKFSSCGPCWRLRDIPRTWTP